MSAGPIDSVFASLTGRPGSHSARRREEEEEEEEEEEVPPAELIAS